jgi:hypothetical protein
MTGMSRRETWPEGHFFQAAFTKRDTQQLHDANTRNLLPDPFQIAHNRQVQRILSNRPDRTASGTMDVLWTHFVANRGAITRSLPQRPLKPEHDPSTTRRRTTGAAHAKVKRGYVVPPGVYARSTRMSITYRPPFDEDDERDLRALYRKPGPGANPELDAAVRRRWHPGHSWHPGWGAAACAVMVAGLFAWTDMREAIDDTEPQMELVAVQANEATQEAASASAAPASDAPPLRRVVALQQEPAVPAQPAAAQPAMAVTAAAPAAPAPAAAETAAAETAAQEAAPAAAQEAPAESQQVAAFTEQDIEARVAQIRGLIVDDREEDAVHALRELQRGAPDFALPDDLQELSRQNPA